MYSELFFFNKFIFYLFIFGCIGSSLLHGLSLVAEWGLLFVVVCRLLVAVASRCGTRALGVWASVVVARGL